jgi:hypothetical protein
MLLPYIIFYCGDVNISAAVVWFGQVHRGITKDQKPDLGLVLPDSMNPELGSERSCLVIFRFECELNPIFFKQQAKKNIDSACTRSYTSNILVASASTCAEIWPFLYTAFNNCSELDVSGASPLCRTVDVIPPLEKACSKGTVLP